jgi:hypothetical protein
MNRSVFGFLALGVIPAAGACASSPPPTVKAAAVAREQCDSSATVEQGVPTVKSAVVLHVEPLYSHFTTADNDEARINGAKILIRPAPGMSAELLTRILQCHSARVLLGQVNAADVPANDPYWLPDAWVHIDVKSQDGNYLVTVSADSMRESREVFGRANRYGDEHMLATDPGLP